MKLPSHEEQRVLHRAVLERNTFALAETYQALFHGMCSILRKVWGRSVSKEDIQDSVSQAITEYVGNPSRYDEQRGLLSKYLLTIADRRLKDRRRTATAEAQRDLNLSLMASVEIESPRANQEPGALLEFEELLAQVEAGLTEQERAVFRLMLMGEERTEVFAELLVLDDLPDDEKRHEVYAYKDRLKKKLRRRLKKEEDDDGNP